MKKLKKKMTVEELVRKFTETGEANDRVLFTRQGSSLSFIMHKKAD